MHRGWPLSSNVLRDILHRMHMPAMKSNLCPCACRSKTITLHSSRTTKSPGSLGTPGPSNGAKFLCKRWYAGIICFILLKIGYFFAGG